MRKSLATIVLCVAVLAATNVRADNLFSSVSIGSPFGSSENQGATPQGSTPQRLAGPASLTQMLREAGMAPREIDTQVVAVNVTVGDSALPVLMSLSEDYDRLRIVVILRSQKEGETVSSDTLIALMDANHENSAAFYAYSKKQRRMELHRIVENRSLTPSRLKAELGGMARIAEQSKELWITKSAAPAVTSTEGVVKAQPQTATPQPRQTTTSAGLIGQWTATRSSTEAFALRIDAAGTYALVTVVNKKTSQSTGKYTLQSNKLTLTDAKGTQIAGTVTLKSAKEFSFQPSGATTPLVFKKAG